MTAKVICPIFSYHDSIKCSIPIFQTYFRLFYAFVPMQCFNWLANVHNFSSILWFIQIIIQKYSQLERKNSQVSLELVKFYRFNLDIKRKEIFFKAQNEIIFLFISVQMAIFLAYFRQINEFALLAQCTTESQQ